MDVTKIYDSVSYDWTSAGTLCYSVHFRVLFGGRVYKCHLVYEDGEYGETQWELTDEAGKVLDPYDNEDDPFFQLFGEEAVFDFGSDAINSIEQRASDARLAAKADWMGKEIVTTEAFADFVLDAAELL